MCIIAVVPKGKRLSEDQFLNCYVNNPHGVGIADSRGVFKTLSIFDAYEHYKTVVGQHVVHFRYASPGIPVRRVLAHPFVINAEGSSINGKYPEGRTRLLFHNGTVSDWRKRFFDLVQNHPERDWKCFKIGAENFSDTRFAAMMAHYYGEQYLEFLTSSTGNGNKFAIYDTKTNDVQMIGEWIKSGELYFTNYDFARYTLKGGEED